MSHLLGEAKALGRREKRRVEAHVRGEADGQADEERQRRKRTEPLKAAQAAYAAALAASSMATPPLQRCELCDCSFTTDAQLQQHLAGVVHRKAAERAAAERARAHVSVAAREAMQAAAWGAGGGSRQQPHAGSGDGGRGGSGGGRGHGRGGRGRGRGQDREVRPPQPTLSHEQMLAQARQPDLSIDGWVPPAVSAQQSHHEKAMATAAEHAHSGGAQPGRESLPPNGGGNEAPGSSTSDSSSSGDSGGGDDSANGDDSARGQPRSFF